MRIACFVALLVFLIAPTAQALSNPKEDPEIAALYKSCAASLSATDEELESNYCYQMISTLRPAAFATRNYIPTVNDENSCKKRKSDTLHDDISKIPPVISSFFSHEEAARSFVALIDSGVEIRDFPLLTSLADRAYAQILADWDKMPHQKPDDSALRKAAEINRKIGEGSAFKPDSTDLINSCKNDGQQTGDNSLYRASISGVLVIYSLAKSHRLPTYPESDTCYQEKNAFLQDFIKARQGCFTPDTDLKKQAAEYIASRWRPEMETAPNKQRSNAPYTAAGLLSSLYDCEN